MCRWLLYSGPEVVAADVLTRPGHSLIQQSFHSELREPLNGDGFGMAWYVPGLSDEPALFRSKEPAWNNLNLAHLARVTSTRMLLAHVRAASPGLGVSNNNCHPFTHGKLAFMHNGNIGGFLGFKRALQQSLSDESYDMIAGSTDSEHAFALYVDAWNSLESEHEPLTRLMEAMRKTVTQLQQWTRELDIPTQLNFAVSDGERAVFTRYGDKGAIPNSLFLHKGNRYECKDGACYMVDVPNGERAILVASEPISGDQGWQEVGENVVMGISADRMLRAPIALS